MCFEVKCQTCGKRTWAGCGLHKDRVMKRIPKKDQCVCGQKGSNNDDGSDSDAGQENNNNNNNNKKDNKKVKSNNNNNNNDNSNANDE